VTQAAFRRQVRLEIYLPLGIALLTLAVLVAISVILGVGTASAWADIALVLVAAPLALLLVVLTAVLAGAIYLLVRLIREVPSFTSGLQAGVDQVAGALQRGSDVAVRPVVVPSGVAASLAEVGRAIKGILKAD
jgi:membrane protein implicated in regulation of membrane protease activity